MIAFGTVSGGAGAALTGGNFWQGAGSTFYEIFDNYTGKLLGNGIW